MQVGPSLLMKSQHVAGTNISVCLVSGCSRYCSCPVSACSHRCQSELSGSQICLWFPCSSFPVVSHCSKIVSKLLSVASSHAHVPFSGSVTAPSIPAFFALSVCVCVCVCPHGISGLFLCPKVPISLSPRNRAPSPFLGALDKANCPLDGCCVS